MKKIGSQLALALVCALLGFFLSYQFKMLRNKEKNPLANYDKTDIVAEIESLTKEKEDLKKKNDELSENLKKIEETATNQGKLDKDIKKDLDSARMITGAVDVKGAGYTIYITPKNNIFTPGGVESGIALGEMELIHLVNSLWYAKAEAISINDIRITPQTGIKTSSNYIWIGDEGRVYPKEKIVIKAIGDKAKLNAALSFGGTLDYEALSHYDKKLEESNELVILKGTQKMNNDNMEVVN